jgi:hypothetical protein
MYEWANVMPMSNGDTASTVCEGTVVDTPNTSENNNDYCSSSITPKSFTEQY